MPLIKSALNWCLENRERLHRVQRHTAATARGVAGRVGRNHQGRIRAGHPDVLHGVDVALERDRSPEGDQGRGVEADTELAE